VVPFIWKLIVPGRGLHPSTFQLNVSVFLCHRGCVKGVLSERCQGVLGGVEGVCLCQKRLRLS